MIFKSKFNFLGIFIGILLSIFFTYTALQNVNFSHILFSLQKIDLSLFVVFSGFTVLMIITRTARWYYLINKIPYSAPDLKYIFATSFIGFAAILIFPFRTGELVRPYLLTAKSSKSQNNLNFSTLLGAVTLERISDGLVVTLSIIIIFLSLNLHTTKMFLSVIFISILFLLALLILIISIFFPKQVSIFTSKILFPNFLTKHLPLLLNLKGKWFNLINEAIKGTILIKKPIYIITFLLFTLLYWIFNVLGVYFLAKSFGLHIDINTATLIMSFAALGIFLPSAPGYFGNYHQFAKTGLSISVTTSVLNGAGMAFIIVLHAMQLIYYLLFGAIGILMGGLKKQYNS